MTSRPSPKFVDANGLRFAYLEEGQGPLVLLMHGFPDTAQTWDAVRPTLAAAGFRAVSPYTRGYFPTAIPADGRYDAEVLGRDVLALIPALGAEQAILVGHDWGASACYAAAALGPERVRLLVTVAIPHPGSLRPSLRLMWGVRHMLRFQFSSAEALLRRDNFAHVDELVQRWSPAWRVPADETAAVKECFRHPGVVEAALGYYRAMSLRPLPALLQPLAMPGAVFCGTDDGVLTREHYARADRFYSRGLEIVAMPGGHFLHREYPQQFSAELLRIVQKSWI